MGPVVTGSDGHRYHGHVVLYDPQRDLAVIDVPGLTEPPLSFAPQAAEGTSAIVAGYPHNNPLTVAAARIGHSVTAYGPNIYQTVFVHRQIYPIRAQIQPGNSGGPLLSSGGRVYGVVFAASTSIPDTGYALTAAEVASDAAAGRSATAVVSTNRCQAG
jgi:S1-C subfamily serine protease